MRRTRVQQVRRDHLENMLNIKYVINIKLTRPFKLCCSPTSGHHGLNVVTLDLEKMDFET